MNHLIDHFSLEYAEMRGLRCQWLESRVPHDRLFIAFHGYPDSPDVWEYQAHFLQNKFQVLLPFSPSLLAQNKNVPVVRLSGRSQALDWLAILDKPEYREKKIVLACHDLSTPMVWELARLLGSRVSQLVVFNGLSSHQILRKFKSARQFFRSWYIFLFQLPWISEKLVTLALPTSGAGVALRSRSGNSTAIRSGRYLNQVMGPLKQYRSYFREAFSASKLPLPELNVATLVIWGIQDPYLVTPSLRDFCDHSLQTTMRLLPLGHWAYREDPDRINNFIEDFTRENLGHEYVK